ncbi:Uncharacterised protein [Bordetella pertussis]|nr:Uncharacterised protein [Bordetella pertussis]
MKRMTSANTARLKPGMCSVGGAMRRCMPRSPGRTQ